MPLYEYRCTACRHQFEVIQSFSDKPKRTCEKCGAKVEKLISRTGFVLKGGGWYKDDYSGKPAKSSEGGDGAASAPPAEAAPAASTEAAAPAAAEKPAKKAKARAKA